MSLAVGIAGCSYPQQPTGGVMDTPAPVPPDALAVKFDPAWHRVGDLEWRIFDVTVHIAPVVAMEVRNNGRSAVTVMLPPLRNEELGELVYPSLESKGLRSVLNPSETGAVYGLYPRLPMSGGHWALVLGTGDDGRLVLLPIN